MQIQNLLSCLNIRQTYLNMPVKSTRTKQRFIENIKSVCRCHYYNAFVILKSRHLCKKSIKCLIPFVGTSISSSISFFTYCIYFINKDNCFSLFSCFFK
jgi:hypothetical protein